MLTKEELNNKYIKYIPEIDEEIFNKIIDKLENLGFVQDGTCSRKKEYSFFKTEYPFLRMTDKKWRITKLNQECEEIQVSDILNENWGKFEVGKWYKGLSDCGGYYGICDGKVTKNNFPCKIFINPEGKYKETGTFFRDFNKATLLTDLSEIQQYLPDGHVDKLPKIIEKWSVGSYIVPLQNKLLSRPEPLTKGKPYKIVENKCIPYILPDNGGKINFVDGSDAEEKEGIKWFATLPEAEDFSKSLLKPEEPEPLTIDNLIEKEIVIKGEFYSLPGYAIFEAGKNGYIGSNGKDWRPDCDNNWAGPENFVPATPLEKKWVITCRKQDRFIPQDQLNMYDSEGTLIENKPKPKQFEFNKWYKRIEPECSKILIFVYDGGYYGFNLDGKWFNAPYFDYSKSDKERLIPATEEEVKEHFISYAKEKYPSGTKFNSTGGNKGCVIDENSSYILNLDGAIVVRNSKGKYIGRLFSQSKLKWAEIIEEDATVINQPIKSKLDMKEKIVEFKPGDKIVGSAKNGSLIHSIGNSSCNSLGVPGKYFVPDKVEYYNDKIIKLWSNGSYWPCYLKDVSLYKEEKKYKKKYVKYNKTFTEDMFNYMLDWAKKQNFPGRPYTFSDNTFNAFKIKEYFWFNCDNNYCYGVDNNPQNNTEITFKELFPEYNPKEMQLSDLKNPIFNIGDKVKVIAESLKEFNSSWTYGNNVQYKKGYEGLITSIDKTKSDSEEVNTWYYLDNNYNAISCNLLELVEPVKKEFDRNWYVKVSSQEEANLVLDWLKDKGEETTTFFNFTENSWSKIWFCLNSKYMCRNTWCLGSNEDLPTNLKEKQLSDILPNYSPKPKVDRNGYYKVNNQEEYCEIMIWLKTIGEPVTTNYFHVIDGWCYIIFNGGRWVLSDTPGSRVEEEYYFKNNKQSSINISPPVQVIYYDSITNEKPKVKIINVPKI